MRINNCLVSIQNMQVNFDPNGLGPALWQIDRALQRGIIFVFCKKGCRRGAALVGCYRMAKTNQQHQPNQRRQQQPREDSHWAGRSQTSDQQ